MLNNLNVVGRLTQDPTLRELKESKVVNIVVAVDNTMTDKNGNKRTTFVQAHAFGNLAEVIAKNFKKGQLIGISGELVQESYTDKQGIDRTTYRVLIEHIAFIEPKSSSTK